MKKSESRHPELTPELVAKILKSNNRVRDLKSIRVSASTFYRYCHRNGIDFRTEHSPYKLDEHDDLMVQKLLEAGLSSRQVADKFGLCHTSVLKRRGRCLKNVPPRG